MRNKKFRIVLLSFLVVLSSFGGSANAQDCESVFKLMNQEESVYTDLDLKQTQRITPEGKIKLRKYFFGGKKYKVNYQSVNGKQLKIKLIEAISKDVLWDSEREKDFTGEMKISFGSSQQILLEIQLISKPDMAQTEECIGVTIRSYDNTMFLDENWVSDPPPLP